MKILISGASGFVGKNLAFYLKDKGHEIVAISRRPAGNSEISWEQLLGDHSSVSNVDVFVHLAGKAHDLKSTSNAGEYFEINTELTKKFFDLFVKSNAGTFIFMSSVKAVADAVEGELKEEVVPDPKTPYGQSKQQAEQYILNGYLPVNKRVLVLRPCMIHGPGNKGNLNVLYNFAKKGIPYPLASFNNKRSFLSIVNLSFIVNNLITDAAVPGGVYNLSDDEPLSTNTVIQLLNEITGKKSRLLKISPAIIKTIAGLGDKLALPLNSEKLNKLTENYMVSNKKIKDALKISRMPVTSAEGLKVTFKSFLQKK
jgi:nucleoside-diphosphate-sugar epimerase